jgi:hypothetical protein
MKINNSCICWNSITRKIKALEMPCGNQMQYYELDSDFGASITAFRDSPQQKQVIIMFGFVLNLIGHEIVDGMDAYEELMKIDECAKHINTWGNVTRHI